jgi:hypothetical protein
MVKSGVRGRRVTVLKELRQSIWRFVFCPLKKLAFPVQDMKTGLKQSRMRYYLVQFSFKNGNKTRAYMEVDSNGKKIRYADNAGKRFIPEEPHECTYLESGKFQFPKWGRKDWSDVFNGNSNSGCWGISER